jgi:hypothetical protein
MKANLPLIIISSVLLTACQKEIFYTDISKETDDYIHLVSAVRSTNYDVHDKFLLSSLQQYTYDTLANKTIVYFKDSSENGVNIYTETFSYANNKLATFKTSNRFGYYSGVDFVYDKNGNPEKAVIHLHNGELMENSFHHTTVNNNKVITMFDTSMLGGRYTYYRPQVISYTFNKSNLLVSQLDIKTGPHKAEGNLLRDTFLYRYGYTPDMNMNRMTMEFTYISNGVNTPHVRDSVAFFRDNKSSALSDTYNHIYKNLYWFSFSEFLNNSFANTMVHNSFYPHYVYYRKQPLRKMEYHHSVFPAGYRSHTEGYFENYYDEDERLIRSVYPKYFANSTWGKQEIEYEYVTMKKR